MAKKFRAVTRIRHGFDKPGQDADGSEISVNEVREFEPGQVVSGLSAKDMKQLWEAGALEEVPGEVVSESSDAPAAQGGGTETAPVVKAVETTPAVKVVETPKE